MCLKEDLGMWVLSCCFCGVFFFFSLSLLLLVFVNLVQVLYHICALENEDFLLDYCL